MEPKEDKRWIVEMEAELVPLHEKFIKNRWEDVSRLRHLSENHDFEGLRRLGHSLLGPPGAFGYDFLVEIGRKLESAAEGKDQKILKELANQFEAFMRNHSVRLVSKRDPF